MFKRTLGIVLLLVGLVGLLISVGGFIISRSVLDGLGASLQTTLSLAEDSLDTVNDTLVLTKTTIDQASTSLDTLAETATNVSVTMNDTQPMLDRVTQSATKEIPTSVESIQEAIPTVAEAAGAIDDTLTVLNSFELDRQIFGIPIQFDLGIDYQPTVPLDDTVLSLGQSLEGMPENLRALEGDMVRTSDNLARISGNIESIASDLEAISGTVDEIEPLIEQYIDIVGQTQELITEAQTDLADQLGLLQLAFMALFIWLGLNQIVPLYMGWTLLTGTGTADSRTAEPQAASPTLAAADDESDATLDHEPDRSDEDMLEEHES